MTDFLTRKAQQLYWEGLKSLREKGFAQAEALLEKALKLDPTLRGAHVELARAADLQGERLKAVRRLHAALEVFPEDAAIWFDLAYHQIDAGQYWQAEQTLLSLRETYPQSRRPLVELAIVWRNTRQFGREEALLREALVQTPHDLTFMNLFAQCLQCRGKVEEAQRWFEKSLKLNRDGKAGRKAASQEQVVPFGESRATMRETLLSHFGTVLLGTGHDNGLHIPWYATYLCSNDDVVVSLGRLREFQRHFGWKWEAVAPVDPVAEVLAVIIGALLNLPVEASALSEPPDGQVLAVASFVGPGWEGSAAGEWAVECGKLGSLFAYGILDYLNHTAPLPPLAAVAGGERICLPWWRLGEARIGFQPGGLLEPLPDEVDPRPPEVIAGDYLTILKDFFPEPVQQEQLSFFQEYRHLWQEGLRARCRVGKVVPVPVWARLPEDPCEWLEHGNVVQVRRGLERLEQAEVLVKRETALLTRVFEKFPDLRNRVAHLLSRHDPEGLAGFLEAKISGEVPYPERDNLIHLYGSNPWVPNPGEVLKRWLREGSASVRSEVVQSKYGLYFLWDEPDREALFRGLLNDEAPIVLGTLHWLHDHPNPEGMGPLVEGLLNKQDVNILFECFQFFRKVKYRLSWSQAAPFLRHKHPRLVSSSTEYLSLFSWEETAATLGRLLRHTSPEVLWAASKAAMLGSYGQLGVELIRKELTSRRITRERAKPIFRGLRDAPTFDHLLPILESVRQPSLVEALVAAAQDVLVGFNDARLLPHIREHWECYVVKPCPGLASYLLRHGSAEEDHATVYAILGAKDSRVGYEAAAVLARWGEEEFRERLREALDYPAVFAGPALEALIVTYGADEFEALDEALQRGELGEAVWAAVRALARDPERGRTLREWVLGSDERSGRWWKFLEDRLRGQIPLAFVPGTQSASFVVFETLFPEGFAALSERILAGKPDRFGLDLLEYLAARHPEQIAALAAQFRESGHWGYREWVRRVALK